MQLVLYDYTFRHVLLCVSIISQHGSAVYVGIVAVVCIPLYNGKPPLAFYRVYIGEKVCRRERWSLFQVKIHQCEENVDDIFCILSFSILILLLLAHIHRGVSIWNWILLWLLECNGIYVLLVPILNLSLGFTIQLLDRGNHPYISTDLGRKHL